jgi:hypothetical protein
MAAPNVARPNRPQNRPQLEFFTYAATLTAVPAGQSSTQNFRIDGDADFVVQGILCSANFGAGVAFRSRSNIIGGTATGTVTGGVGGTPTANFESVDVADQVKLYRDGQPNGAGVNNIGLHLVRLAFQDNNRQWQNEPIRADLLTMEPGRSLFLPTPQTIAANANLTVVAYNDMPAGSNDGTANALRGVLGNAGGTTAPTITIQVALLGYKRKRV